MHFAKHSAANALIDGWKSVELCQAYIMMSIYAVPAKRWEEDRSWLYTGLAIRCAICFRLVCFLSERSGVDSFFPQDRDGFKFASSFVSDTTEREARARNLKQDTCVDDLFQP